MTTEVFTKGQFEKVLPLHKETGKPMWEHAGLIKGEHVYTVGVIDTNKRIVIRSSVRRDGQSAGTGNDSIRCRVEYYYQGGWRQLGTRGRINRTPGWDGRLVAKLRELYVWALNDSKKHDKRIKDAQRRDDEERGANEKLSHELAGTSPEDMAKLELLKERLDDSLNTEAKDTLAELERLQERVAFATDPDLGSVDMVRDAKEALRKFNSKRKRSHPKRVICPACGSVMKKRSGKYGEFYGCGSFPKCRKTLQLDQAKAQLEIADGQPKEFAPSEYQGRIFIFVTDETGNLVVEALAGSGKTTTIVEALKLTKGSVLFCAFNKHIQRELSRRAPGHVTVSTIHSIGFRALCNALPVKPEVDDSKLWGIVKELLPEADQYPLRKPLVDMVSMAKKTLTDWTDPVALEEMGDYYGLDLNGNAEQIIGLIPRAMVLCAERVSVIDFDDMIWLPTQLGIAMKQFDWVFVDEAQDLSRAQAAIVKASLKDTGRIILVGDRHQSIYGFTGADCNSIPRLIEEFGAKTLPLSITYRCPKRVVELAQRLVPALEAAEWAEDGTVTTVSEYTWKRQVKDRDLVLCRINAPLVSACYSFIRRGVKAVIRGRDIGKGLLNFIDKLAPMDVNDLMVKVNEYKRTEVVKLEKAGKEARAQSVQDRCETLVALCDGVNDLTTLRANIKKIFDDDSKDGIILSSIHRSKGDEADNVYILHRELLPHPLATKDWQRQQEANLEYVAYTRAKKNLVFVVS